ncbi:MAG: PP2C family protein-serine/threonine phosphatase [Acidobacteriota bacterium]|nr:PP2C family protein-serine/threonine phosphatase [Acidobacteriota bacterium]
MTTDWKSLAKETVHSFDADEVRGMWDVDWQRATNVFLADHEAEIAAEPRRWKRGLRKTNAVVFGLAKRLAPPRRLVFALVLVLVVLAVLEHAASDGQSGWSHFALLVSVLALAFLLAMELVDKLHFKDELVMARELQAQLVPRVLPEIGAFELGGFNRIANTVGGDLYAFEPIPGGRLAVLFGDASGHGMAAGLVMAVTHAVFRTQLPIDPSPGAMVEALNRVLCETGNSRSFFAGVYAVLEPGGGVTATVAGHPPVLKVDAAGRIVERLGSGSYPLGIKKSVSYAPESTVLAPGEMLLFHSDGLPEARGLAGEEFGDTRVALVLDRQAGAAPYTVVAALVSELDRFLGRAACDDDVSIAAIRRKSA